jgi:hypothetical protein
MVPYQNPVTLYAVPSRRLEDRIQELCRKLIAARGSDLEPLIAELKEALREHSKRLRKLAADGLLKARPLEERRKR